jgi:hypothetical protein
LDQTPHFDDGARLATRWTLHGPPEPVSPTRLFVRAARVVRVASKRRERAIDAGTLARQLGGAFWSAANARGPVRLPETGGGSVMGGA